MEITDTYVQDMKVTIRLAESESFDVTYENWYKSRENQTRIRIGGLIASVDLLGGTVSVTGYGYLINKNGQVGERERNLLLEVDDIPFEVRDIIAEEARQAREHIAAVQGVRFE